MSNSMFHSKKREEMVLDIREKYSEYLEMIEHPDLFVIGVLSNKIIQLEDYVEYLERRLKA